MKAEHRKELHTNYLANQMGKMLDRAKGSSSALWVFLVVAVLLGVGFWWWRGQTLNAISGAWVDYWQGRDTLTGAEDVAKRHKGTAAERAAKLVQADQLYQRAYEDFFRSPSNARERFKQASEIYQDLADHPGNSSDLAVRGLMGAAKCQEWLGEQERATFFYAEVINRHENHPLAEQARERKKELETQGSDALSFYRGWPTRLPATVGRRPPIGEDE